MKTIIHPGKNKNVTIELPCSKSLAHRYIICACLASGRSNIYNITYNQDILSTIEIMRHFNAKIIDKNDYLEIDGITKLKYDHEILDCHESGSTLRFMIPLCALIEEDVYLTGTSRLLERPQSVYEELFNKQHVKFIHNNDSIIVGSYLQSGTIEVDGNISSQFITGLLLALSLLKNDSTIVIKPPFASKPYVDLTIDVMNSFGIKVNYVDDYKLYIKGGQKFVGGNHLIEADYSQLAFFAALGVLNNGIRVGSFNKDSKQGDKVIVDILKDMGADIEKDGNYYLFKPSELSATTIDLENCPDLGPMLFALSTQAKGTTKFINAKRLRIKESDRIQAMEDELRKLGVDIYSNENEVYVNYQPNIVAKDVLNGHNDHRIVMALSILATIAKNDVVIEGSQAIAKSYPRFFDDLSLAKIEVKHYDN